MIVDFEDLTEGTAIDAMYYFIAICDVISCFVFIELTTLQSKLLFSGLESAVGMRIGFKLCERVELI
jgi:hypothetical protein